MSNCKLSRILWGVVLIVMLSLTTLEFKRADIEIDLEKRSEQALLKAGIKWAEFSFIGMNGYLHKAENRTAEERRQALNVVKNVFGVHKVKDASKPLKLVSPYVWSASIGDGKLKLSSYIPSEADRKAILGIAQATFPKFTIKDKMKVARGAGDKSVWLGSVSFALKQLSFIEKGSVVLKNQSLRVWGRALDSDSYIAISKKLKENAPKGMVIGSYKIFPPKVDDYRVSIKMDGTKVKLDGYVPDIDTRKDLTQKLSTSMKNAEVVDNLRYASGEPKGWKGMFKTATQEVFKLKNGAVELSEKRVAISGTVDTHQKHASIKKKLTDNLPKGYSLEDNIKVEVRESTVEPKGQRHASFVSIP